MVTMARVAEGGLRSERGEIEMMIHREPEFYEQMKWLCQKAYKDGLASIPGQWQDVLLKYVGFDIAGLK